MSDMTYVRGLTAGVLADLGLEPGWRVADVTEAGDAAPPPRAGLATATHLLITVTGPDDQDRFQVHYTEGIGRADATVATAEQLQDHVIELLGGAAVPPCPGHPHPLTPGVVDGEPLWVCPRDPGHHRAPLTR